MVLTFDASKLRVAGIAWLADARWIMVRYRTLGVWSAVTWVDTQSVEARFRPSAVAVGSAFRHKCRWYAFDFSISHVVIWALADGNVLVHVTQSVGSAHVTRDARVGAERVDTLPVIAAFVVGVALGMRWWYWNYWDQRALDVRVAGVVGRAQAVAVMERRSALGVESALSDMASIDARASQAFLVVLALVVG